MKVSLYATFQIPEVWIVDVAGAAIEAYRDPKAGAYTPPIPATGGTLAALFAPNAVIDVESLFS